MQIQVSAERARKAAAFKALPVAKILSPLKFIMSRCGHVVTNMDGTKERRPTKFAMRAYRFAQAGNGQVVHAMALTVL